MRNRVSLLSLSAFVFAISWGAPAQAWETSTPAFCQPGLTTISPQVAALFDDAMNEIANGQGSRVLDWPSDLTGNPKCSEYFVDASGEIGPIYSVIAKKIAKDVQLDGNSPLMQNYPDILDLCPGFINFTAQQKVGFWTWFMEALASIESSCDPHKTNPNATDGTGVGLFQMNAKHSDRVGRGPDCEVSDSSMKTATGNAACAVDILESQLQQNQTPFGLLGDGGWISKKSYWQPLNPLSRWKRLWKNEPHNVFMSELADYPGCQSN